MTRMKYLHRQVIKNIFSKIAQAEKFVSFVNQQN